MRDRPYLLVRGHVRRRRRPPRRGTPGRGAEPPRRGPCAHAWRAGARAPRAARPHALRGAGGRGHRHRRGTHPLEVPRLDVLVTRNGLAESRERAQALILAGQVRVAGETIRKPDRSVSEDAAISIESAPDYASRGALKLAPALETFGVDPSGRVCADIGASTGGFSGVLLRRRAAPVDAYDIGRRVLHWRL